MLLKTFKTAAWLGWQIESNWTDLFLFSIYAIIKPLAGAAILVVMYSVITRGDYNSPLFTYMFMGNAFYIIVGQMINGMAWAVVDDREHYKTLKYMYIAPIHYPTYLIGRSVASFLVASVSVIITITVGVLFLHVRFNLSAVDWPLFLVSLFIGIAFLSMMGLIMASFMLLSAHHVWDIGGAVAGSLFIFTGAVFPLQTLPVVLRPIGYLMPITYWLELLRRSLVGTVAQAYPILEGATNLELLGILIALTIIVTGIAIYSYRSCEQKARERGMLDMVTNY